MHRKPIVELPSGIFTISLDFELIWGTLDKPKHRRFRRLCAIEREEVIDRLLALFTEYRISATWCTVGHLFLDQSHVTDARATGADGPIFYGRDLIEKIRECSVPQEIGSHTFSHAIFDDPLCTRSVANRELSNSTRIALEMGVGMTSFAFPRNRVAHLDLLPRHGFNVFRGQDTSWYEQTSERRWFHRAGHLIDILCATCPTPSLPVWHNEGIWELPGSMLFTPSHGLRCLVPARTRVNRARKGLLAAAESKKIFHLWFHPTDLVVRKDAMLEGLRQILESACQLRDAGRLEILPLCAIAELLNQRDRPHLEPALNEEVYL